MTIPPWLPNALSVLRIALLPIWLLLALRAEPLGPILVLLLILLIVIALAGAPPSIIASMSAAVLLLAIPSTVAYLISGWR
jgi:cell division protein FtsW (lipid II flippase)